MVLHGLKRIFQKPTPDISSSERTNQLRSKTIYAGTVELSTALNIPGSTRYKTYNGPFEIVNDNGSGSLVASSSYKDLLDITKGKVLLNQLPLTSLTAGYYKKNFGNGEMYVGNYQEFNGSFFSGEVSPTGCTGSVLVYDITTTGFTGRHSYTENSIGNTGATGMADSSEHIFIDPKHCYYSEQCASSASYMKFVDIDLKGANGPSQYYSQQIINSNQYSGFSFPMSNFSLTCVQQNPLQTEGPLFCPVQPPYLSGFSVPPEVYDSPPFQITPPQSNSLGSFTYSSSNTSVATISGPNFDMITILASGTSTITAFQAATVDYSSGSISTLFYVTPATFTASWHYTNDGGTTFTDINFSQQIPYDFSTYTISVKETFPENAIYTQLGTASVTNVNDATAQLTLTGYGNFVGSVQSPSITVIPIPPTFTGSLSIPPSVDYSLVPVSYTITLPTSNSSGAFSYTCTNSSVTFSGNTFIINADVDVGTYTITAIQDQYGNFTQGNVGTASFNVVPAPPTPTNLSWPSSYPSPLTIYVLYGNDPPTYPNPPNRLTLDAPISDRDGQITMTSQDNSFDFNSIDNLQMQFESSGGVTTPSQYTLIGRTLSLVETVGIYASMVASAPYAAANIENTVNVSYYEPPMPPPF